jgi:hypothetical protein
MFDAIPDTVFWPLFMLFWLLAGFIVAYVVGGIIRWCDNPMNRTRRNINGRKQMATDWRKPSNLPDDWK